MLQNTYGYEQHVTQKNQPVQRASTIPRYGAFSQTFPDISNSKNQSWVLVVTAIGALPIFPSFASGGKPCKHNFFNVTPLTRFTFCFTPSTLETRTMTSTPISKSSPIAG